MAQKPGTDTTNEPGQYPPGAWGNELFGGALPDGTGAPGTRGAGDGAAEERAPDDPLGGTTTAAIDETGAPGSQGSPAGDRGTSSVTYTRPNAGIGAEEHVSGGSDGTEANADGYGGGGPKLPGMQEPTSTGAGKGRVNKNLTRG